jgi:putative ABC transport system permease protein
MKQLFISLAWSLRDIRSGFRAFYLALICLVIGLASITTVQVVASSILQSIEKNSRTILGADWVVRQIYNPIGEREHQWIKEKGAKISETIEMRPMLINPKTGDTVLVELKVVDEIYPLYGEVTIASGQNFKNKIGKGLILDPSLQERLQVSEGQNVQLGSQEIPVADWIVNEPDRAGSGRFGLAPRVIISRNYFKQTELEKPGSLISYDTRVQWTGKEIPSAEDFQSDFPDATWRLTTSENASPQIQRFVRNLLQFMTLVGLSALLIGGIGVANGLGIFFEKRLTSIAIYKMIGVPQQMLRQIYGFQIAMMTAIGVFIGVGIGALLPLVGLSFIREMLPFPITIAYSFESLAAPALFGILITWIFALWPFGKAELTSPLLLFRQGLPDGVKRPAFDIVVIMITLVVCLSGFIFITAVDQRFALFFIIGAFTCFIVFWGIGFFIRKVTGKMAGRMSLVSRLALTNLGGPRSATILTLVSIGIGLTVLGGITLIDRNMRGILTERMPVDAPSFFFLDIQPHQKPDFQAMIENWPTTRKLVMTPNLRGRIVSVNGVKAEEALIDQRERWLLQNDRGFTYLAKQPDHSTVTSGEWWPENYQGPPLISVVDDVERGFGIKVGDQVTVNILGRDITAKVANVREVNWTSFTINFAITFAPGVLDKAPHNWLATVIAPVEDEAALQKQISRQFPNISMVRVSEAVKSIQTILSQMVAAVRIMAILALVTGVFVLAGALISTRIQRSYDIVILKVLGMSRRQMLKGLGIEFIILGLTASLIAALLAIGISWGVLEPLMDLGWIFYPLLTAGIIFCGLFIIFITGLWTMWSILNASAGNFLRND